MIHEKRFKCINVLYRTDRDSGRDETFLLRFFFLSFFCCFFVDILKLISFQCFYLHINFFLKGIVMGIRAFIETEQ